MVACPNIEQIPHKMMSEFLLTNEQILPPEDTLMLCAQILWFQCTQNHGFWCGIERDTSCLLPTRHLNQKKVGEIRAPPTFP
jgi:hypothetical protein